MDKMNQEQVLTSVERLEEGFSEVLYRGHRYTVTKTIFNSGRSVKVFAQNLANKDFISFNLYKTKAGIRLKPCEMSEEKVTSFLKEYDQTPS